MLTIRYRRLAAFVVPAGIALALLALAASVMAAPLPAGIVDPDAVSVSGVSAGGYMAVQLHVAHSATFRRGAGVVAGGPYYCAEGQLPNALDRCMAGTDPIPVTRLVATTRDWAARGFVDPVENLRASRVYLFAGARDGVVVPAVVRALRDYYRNFMPADHILLNDDVPAEHGMVTEDAGNACHVRGAPFLVDCDFDLAGAMLAHLHGPLDPRNDGAPAGRAVEFDQRLHGAGRGLAARGHAYVPDGCTPQSRCALHVVLHGCRQNEDEIGRRFVEGAGYNRWADTNRLVVLYPQTGADAVNGCWDWWGYGSPDYARRSGPQMAAIKSMVDRLAGLAPGEPADGPLARCHTATNLGHAWAGRATLFWGVARARGSREPLGWWFASTTLKEDPPGHYAIGTCP